MLEDEPHAPPLRGRCVASSPVSSTSPCRPPPARDDPQDGALARPGGTQKRDELTGRDLERDILTAWNEPYRFERSLTSMLMVDSLFDAGGVVQESRSRGTSFDRRMVERETRELAPVAAVVPDSPFRLRGACEVDRRTAV